MFAYIKALKRENLKAYAISYLPVCYERVMTGYGKEWGDWATLILFRLLNPVCSCPSQFVWRLKKSIIIPSDHQLFFELATAVKKCILRVILFGDLEENGLWYSSLSNREALCHTCAGIG